jgi:hypothetical protein
MLIYLFLLFSGPLHFHYLNWEETILSNNTDVYNITLEKNKLAFINIIGENLNFEIRQQDSLVCYSNTSCIFFTHEEQYKIKVINKNNKDVEYEVWIQ